MPQLKIDSAHRVKGICLAMISVFGFGFMQVFVRLTSGEISVMEQTFFRNLVGLFVVGAIVWRNGIPFFGELRYQPQLFGRSLSGFVGVMLLFYAVRHSVLADVSIVTGTSMFTITAASVLLLHERLTRMHVPAILLAFTGAFIAANPRFDSSFLPMLAAFGSALCTTVAYVLLSYFSGRVNPLTVVMHFCTVSTLGSIPLMWSTFVLPAGWDLFCLVMIGVLAALTQVAMTYSYRMLPAGEISVYDQTAIFFNAMLGYIFLGEVPTPRTVVGGTLVMVASVLLFLSKRRQAARAGEGGDGRHAAVED